MEYATIAGNYYTITSKNGCSVTDSTGTLNETVDAGKQLTVQAPSDKLVYDDEQAIIFKSNFKQALAALGLLGGGDKLPMGYARLEFLEATGSQYINTRLPAKNITVRSKYRPFAAAGGNGRPAFHSQKNEVVNGSLFYNNILATTQSNQGGGGYVVVIQCLGRLVNVIFYDLPFGLLTESEVNLKDLFIKCTVEGKGARSTAIPSSFREKDFGYMGLCNFSNPYIGYIYSFDANYDGTPAANYIPALDSTGTPCMFDLVSKQPFSNAGSRQFVAGVKNASQLRTVLRKLPDLTGQDMGTLTLSIPAEANTPEMQELLDTTETQKNWELTIKERDSEVATYTLRRVRKVVWVRRVPDKNGGYVAADGSRWQTEWCSAIYSPLGNDPTLHGYEPFGSVEQAVEAWGLEPYVDPNAEDELLTEYENHGQDAN